MYGYMLVRMIRRYLFNDSNVNIPLCVAFFSMAIGFHHSFLSTHRSLCPSTVTSFIECCSAFFLKALTTASEHSIFCGGSRYRSFSSCVDSSWCVSSALPGTPYSDQATLTTDCISMSTWSFCTSCSACLLL